MPWSALVAVPADGYWSGMFLASAATACMQNGQLCALTLVNRPDVKAMQNGGSARITETSANHAR